MRIYTVDVTRNNSEFNVPSNYNNGDSVIEQFEKFVRVNPIKHNLFKDRSTLILSGGKAIDYLYRHIDKSITKGTDFDFSYYSGSLNSDPMKVKSIFKRIDSVFIPYIQNFLKTLNKKYKISKRYSIQGGGKYTNINNMKSCNVILQNKVLSRTQKRLRLY